MRSHAAETGAISNAGRNGDYGNTDKSADDARQRSFHAGHHDHHTRCAQSLSAIEQPMQTRHAYII